MKVRATAVAAERSNAIGTVELECTPHGLGVVYLGVGSFTQGYAPGALTSGTRIVVPWAQVEETRVEGELIYVALDPAITPHSRMVLTGFSTGDFAHPSETGKQRLVVWIGAGASALVASMVAALTIPRFAPQAGASATIATGGLAGLAILVVGLLADRQLGRSSLEGHAAREAFAVELSRYLPSLVRLPEAPKPKPKPFRLPAFDAWIPRTTAAVVITLTACLLGAVLTARWLLTPSRAEQELATNDTRAERSRESEPARQLQAPPPPAPPPAPTESADEAPKPSEAPAGNAANVEGRCACKRSDSLLWADPIPKLGIVMIHQKVISGPVKKRLNIDVAAINNGDKDIRELAMTLAFYEHDPVKSDDPTKSPTPGKAVAVEHSAVYFEGPLKPGQAIKWNVEERGTTVEVDRPFPGDIGPTGDGAAPANLIAELLEANHRPVRLHGAMMLAFLGDPRARDATLKLKEALREDEGPYLDRLLRALGDVRTCELRIADKGLERTLEACVFNASNEPKQKLALRVRGLDAKVNPSDPIGKPPNVVVEATLPLPAELAAQDGVRLRAKLDVSKASTNPAAFEAFADRADLLP